VTVWQKVALFGWHVDYTLPVIVVPLPALEFFAMKIVIAGAGEVGSHLARLLVDDGHDVTVIDPDADRLEKVALTSDVITMQGSTTSFEVLQGSGIYKADLLIAVTPSEDTNIVTCMLSKKMGAKRTIARIDHNEYLDFENRSTFSKAGVDYMFYPEVIAATEIVNLLSQTSSSEFIDFAGGKMVLLSFKLEENAPIIGKMLLEAVTDRKTLRYRTVAITRDEKTIIPRGDDRFEVDDQIYVIANRDGIDEMLAFSGKENIDVHNLMILGGSRIGTKVATMLDHRMNIKIIESNKERCYTLSELFDHAMVINGDGRNSELLMEEGIQKTDAFVAVTGNSETNILACLFAKQVGVQRTIAEVENMDYIQLAESIGIDTIINKKLITAGHIFKFTQDTDVQTVRYLSGTNAEVLEYIVKPNSQATLHAIKDLDFPKNATIGGIIRGGKGIVAAGDAEIQAHDHVIVFSIESDPTEVGEFFN
jgi:trk system potassium uptake protein TrkA